MAEKDINSKILHDFTFKPAAEKKQENIDKNKNIKQEEVKRKKVQSLKSASFGLKEDTYAKDTRTRLKRRIKKASFTEYDVSGSILNLAHKKFKKKHRKKIKELKQKKNLKLSANTSNIVLAKVKEKYNAPGLPKKVSLEEAKRNINLEYGLSGSKIGQALKKNLYTPKGFHVGIGKNKKFIQTGYRKIYTDSYLNRYSGRRLAHDTKNIMKGSGKLGTKTAINVTKEGVRALKDNYVSSLKKDGFSGETLAKAHDTIKTANQTKKVVQDTTYVSKNVVLGTAKGLKLTYNGASKVGSIALEKTKNGIRFYKHNKGDMKNALKREMKARVQKLRSQWNKKAIEEKLQKTAKKVKKKAIELLKKIKDLIIKIIMSIGVPAIIAITIIIIIFMVFSSLIGIFGQLNIPMEDYNSYRTVVDICEEYSEEWQNFIEEDLVNSFTEPQVRCAYGNLNKLELEFSCEDGNEDEAEIHFIIDPVEIYCLCIAVYEGEIGNLGVAYGNEYEAETPDETEIREYIKSVLELYYPMNYMESDRYTINQDLYMCDETLMDTQFDEYGRRIAWDVSPEDIRVYQRSFDKSSLYFPRENEQGQSEKNHQYIETKIEIRFITFTKVLDYLSLEDDVLENYAYYLNAFIPHAKEVQADPESEVKVPIWFWNTLIDQTVNDRLSSEELDELFKNATPSGITRKEFTDMIYSYCSPKGQIPYVWGGSSYNGSDCSGFISLMLKKINIGISGWSGYLWENSVAIDASQAKPGDLVFKQSPSSNGINHIGFYLGEGYEDGIYGHCASGSGTISNNYKGFVYYRRLIIKFKDDL